MYEKKLFLYIISVIISGALSIVRIKIVHYYSRFPHFFLFIFQLFFNIIFLLLSRVDSVVLFTYLIGLFFGLCRLFVFGFSEGFY